MSSEEKSSVPANDEIYHEIYLALQAIIACPGRCKCCKEHDERALKALGDFLNRYRPEPEATGTN